MNSAALIPGFTGKRHEQRRWNGGKVRTENLWTTGSAAPPESGAPRTVTHLGKFFHPAKGGIENTVRSLAYAQARLGYSVRVICMDHERGSTTRVERDGPLEVIRVRRARSVGKFDHCPDLPRVVRDAGGDLLHLHTPNPSMIVGLLLSGDRRPLVVSHHSDVIKQRIRRMLFSPVERRCYDRARLVLAMSPPYAAGSMLLRSYSDRLAVLPIGLELTPFLEPSAEVLNQAERLREQHPGPIWFSCGRLVYYKGLETAILALRTVPGTLLIAGDGPSRAGLERLAARHGLGERVRFLGKVARDDDIAACYRAATAFWFPSNARSEAYGLVQVEAMASGCPVINTAIPRSGVAWVSRHEETGLTVPVDDPIAFAAAALRMIDEPGLRDRLATGARERAMSEFRCESMGRRSHEFYLRVLSGVTCTG